MVVNGFSAPDSSTLGRRQLLQWVNDEFGLKLNKIEQCGTGAVYALIVDRITWGYRDDGKGVGVQKLRWDTDNEYDIIDNFKVLQKAFIDFKIEKHIDIDALKKMRMQDNLAFLSWLHNLYARYHDPTVEQSYPGPVSRRNESRRGFLPCFVSSNAENGEQRREARRPPMGAARRPVRAEHHPYGEDEVEALRVEIGLMKKKIEQQEELIDSAERDLEKMNTERAQYWLSLFRLDKLREVREASRQLVQPAEIKDCMDGRLPADLVQYKEEFDKEFQDICDLLVKK